MEYHDLDEIIAPLRSAPLLGPIDFPPSGPMSLVPGAFPMSLVPRGFVVNGSLNRPYPYVPASEYADLWDSVAGAHFPITEQRTWSHESLGPVLAKALHSTHSDFPNPGKLVPKRSRKRLGLPLTVFTNTKEEFIIACPDSGSDDNIISRQIADQFGLPITEIKDSAPSTFVLANGRTVSAVGQVHLKCAFRQGSPAAGLIDCVFYVFQTLAVPMIMGIEFLHTTKTLTKHRDRLIEELVPLRQSIRVCSVGRPKRGVACRVGNYLGCATADTGSDLDLVSPEFAAARAFDVEDSCVELQFADGSTGYTMGMIKTSFSIGRISDFGAFIPRSNETHLEFFILEHLNADILVGADTIQDLQAFSGHEECFIPAVPRLGESDLNIIRYIGAVERGFSSAWEGLKDSFTSSKNKQAPAINQDHTRKRLQQHDQLLHDQLHNRSHLRSTERSPREGLPSKQPLLPSLGPESLTPLSTGSHHRRQAQEKVLKSRRHFCPVKGCSSAKGGKGFKSNKDMIRHSMIHGSRDYRSTGYACGFFLVKKEDRLLLT